MNNSKRHYERPKRRFCEATDGPIIRQFYATMRTVELAQRLGLTVKQITNYVYRHSGEPWAKKEMSILSRENRENGKRGGRPRKKS